jgi:hypothetical protein
MYDLFFYSILKRVITSNLGHEKMNNILDKVVQHPSHLRSQSSPTKIPSLFDNRSPRRLQNKNHINRIHSDWE